ncbi:FAD-binding protein [Bacillus mycoides]|uniref:FAD-binding protein n=1 Tax=Bacillus mycoides TaxID=1405 RepID=UPI003CFE5742
MIIIGSGITGLMATYFACEKGVKVKLITKNNYNFNGYQWSESGGCSWKTHAFNVASQRNDSTEMHYTDTMEGSSFLANPTLARTLCEKAPEIISFLESIGLKIERDETGNIATKPFGGCGVPRAVHIEDRLGYHITSALNNKLTKFIKNGLLEILSQRRIISLEKEEKIYKLYVQNVTTNEMKLIKSTTVIFADGGGASMYYPSAVTLDKTCDGIALALKLGIDLVDMEFVQFHPTGLISKNPKFNGTLFEESLRFAGAKLFNVHEERFLFNYEELGEQATRDKVSRAIYMEIQKGNGFKNGGVKLDFHDCYNILMSEYPALLERLKQAGYNPQKEKHVYIKPTAHFMMGGVKINEKCETSKEGLYYAGESAGGVHGANRLGGNGLTEALVFGKIAGERAAEYERIHGTLYDELHMDPFSMLDNGTENLIDNMESFKKEMYNNAGIVRKTEDLNYMLHKIEEYRNKKYKVNTFNSVFLSQLYLDFSNQLMVSESIIKSALQREESRGSHYRVDFNTSSHKNSNNFVKMIESELYVNNIVREETRYLQEV